MKKKILLLIGSMDNNGNTSKLAKAFKQGAEEKKHSVTTIDFSELKINHCQGCNKCVENKMLCVQNDDMDIIYDNFYSHDTIVFAVPLYFHSFPSLMKAVIDRLYAVGATCDFIYPVKNSALLVTASDNFDETFKEILSYYKYVFIESLKWNDLGTLCVKNCGGVTTARAIEQTEGLTRGYRFGVKL